MADLNDGRKQWAKIVAKAWADEQYKQRLLNDPAAVFAEEGIEVPQGKRLSIREAKEDEVCLILPAMPSDLDPDEVVEERLAAACFTQSIFCC